MTEEEKSPEQRILEAAGRNDINLVTMIQAAVEDMDAAQANRLFDKVTQILKEGLREAREWKTND